MRVLPTEVSRIIFFSFPAFVLSIRDRFLPGVQSGV
jgi:hypothetical protein